MFGSMRNRKMVAAGVCGVAALLVAGCGTSIPRGSEMALLTGPGTAEPNPFEALVVADASLGASDPLGAQVFVANTDARFAMGHMVWQMAAAEDPSIKLDNVYGNTDYGPVLQEQRIVSADEMRARKLQRQGLEPKMQQPGVDLETATGEPETIRQQFQDEQR